MTSHYICNEKKVIDSVNNYLLQCNRNNFASFSDSVVIPHSNDIDSLNLPIAASIAIYEFTKNRWR